MPFSLDAHSVYFGFQAHSTKIRKKRIPLRVYGDRLRGIFNSLQEMVISDSTIFYNGREDYLKKISFV